MAAQYPQSALNFIQISYQTIDRLNLSMEMLAVIAVVVTIAFLLAMRELAAWFFKIDDLKRDIRSLEVGISRLEGEIKALQSKDSNPFGEPTAMAAPHLVVERRRAEQFPINH